MNTIIVLLNVPSNSPPKSMSTLRLNRDAKLYPEFVGKHVTGNLLNLSTAQKLMLLVCSGITIAAEAW